MGCVSWDKMSGYGGRMSGEGCSVRWVGDPGSGMKRGSGKERKIKESRLKSERGVNVRFSGSFFLFFPCFPSIFLPPFHSPSFSFFCLFLYPHKRGFPFFSPQKRNEERKKRGGKEKDTQT